MSLLTKISTLPNEIIDKLVSFLSPVVLVFVNKKYYTKFHNKFIYTLLPRKIHDIDNYIRFITRNDYDFVLNNLFENKPNPQILLSTKRIKYKNKSYKNYLHYLLEFSIHHFAYKCCHLIRNKIRHT